MKWNIVSDSSCDLFARDIACEKVGFHTIPFILQIGEQEYLDDESLDVAKMLKEMEDCPTVSHTACPSVGSWVDAFKMAEHTIAITISGRLSGSQNSAKVAREVLLEQEPEKKILVLDSYSTGPKLALCIYKLREWIQAGLSFEEISKLAKQFVEETPTTFALCSYENLIKNGRMNKIVGFIARKLDMWGVGVASKQGEIEVKGKTRGPAGALRMILDDMKKRGFSGGEVAISHCFNEELALTLKEKIHEQWQTAKITILPTRGLDSFYAERGGLIVSFIA